MSVRRDLEESVEVVIAGYQKKNKILTDKEKLIVAYHEDRACAGGGPAEPFGSGDKDHDYPQNIRSSGLYDAG